MLLLGYFPSHFLFLGSHSFPCRSLLLGTNMPCDMCVYVCMHVMYVVCMYRLNIAASAIWKIWHGKEWARDKYSTR